MTQSERKIRYVVIGAGNLAQVAVLPAFQHAAHSELVGLVSGDAHKRETLARRHGLTHVGDYDQLEDVLAQADADAVYIALPNAQHRAFTERAARAGVHVLCEKPMAETVADCQAMIDACRSAQVKLMIAYRLHFEAANLSAIEIARSGALGELRIFSSVFSQVVRDGDVRTHGELAGGAAYDMGVYPINAARNLFGEEPVEVLASCQSGFDAVDATSTAILRFSQGRVAQLTASLDAAHVDYYRLLGTRGALHVEPAYDYTADLTQHLTVHGKTVSQTFPRRDQFAPELVHFSECIMYNLQPGPSGEEGLADVRIVRAIFRAAETGKAVVLTPFTRASRPDLAQEMHAPPVEPPTPIDAPSPSGT